MDEETQMYLASLQGGMPQGNSFGWGASGPSMSMSQPVNFLAPPSTQSLFSQVPYQPGGLSMQGAQGPTSFLGKTGSWLSNGNNLGSLVQGIGTLGSLYLGYQQMKQAKQAFGLQKEMANLNANNSIKNYNTSLEDRIRGRTADYAGKENDVQSYLAKHKLSR